MKKITTEDYFKLQKLATEVLNVSSNIDNSKQNGNEADEAGFTNSDYINWLNNIETDLTEFVNKLYSFNNKPLNDSNLSHLIDGGKLEDDRGTIFKFKGIMLEALNVEDAKSTYRQFPLKTVNSDYFEIYLTDEEREIKRLKDIIATQNDVIQKLSKPKIERSYKILQPDELEDFKAQVDAGTPMKEIAEIFNMGYSTTTKKVALYKAGKL